MGHGQVTEVHRLITIWLGVCVFALLYSPLYSVLLFLLQSPDKKKVLTPQRTFDSEGENFFHLCFRKFFAFVLL